MSNNDGTRRARKEILLRYPEIESRLEATGSWGGRYSSLAAAHIFARNNVDVVDDIISKTIVEPVLERSWVIRMPMVNSCVFETDDGLVVVDTGMLPGGPALRLAINSVSSMPIHTIIYTHAHPDHAYGTWALIEGETANIVAHRSAKEIFEQHIRYGGHYARLMDQDPTELPTSIDELIPPTQVFDNELRLEVGGETIELMHYPAETVDHIFVWFPGRGALACGDYFQGTLPNLGNGRRPMRQAEGWIAAVRKMISLRPRHLIPGHGEALSDPIIINRELQMLGDALAYVEEHVRTRLNTGARRDQVAEDLEWPERFKSHPTLRSDYVSPEDLCRAVAHRWTGWWDDVPSHWDPAPLREQANLIVDLAGGIDQLLQRCSDLAKTDLRLACHLADWLWLAEAANRRVRDAAMDVYTRRILESSNTNQATRVYLDHLGRLADEL
jgi:glyoxylase-like metal-dependent hydrolase (beta-lactamase superfamily II)